MSGGAAGSSAPFAPVPTAAQHDAEWKRKLFAILIAFVFGFLLAWFLKKCPQQAPGGGGGGSGDISVNGGRTPGTKGSPIKLGDGAGTPGGGGGGGGGGPMKVDGGGGAGDGGGDADLPTGNSPPGKGGTASEDPPMQHGQGKDMAGDAIIKSAEGGLTGKGLMGDTLPAGPPPATLQMAHDFSLDSTGLPRYSSGVTTIASGMSTDTVRHKKSTIAAIVTNDSFDNVVDWYKGQVPAGWHNAVVGDMDAMTKALSPDAIKNMISGAMSGGPVDTAAVTAAAAGRKTGVAIFSPPNQTADPRSIMVVTKPGKPVEIIMSKKLQP
ncbi:MAG TPA: hypothetical protein VGO46_08980 [Gemmatimonadaceae bacterium]|nr:hypothetical protein [Gemmatimonadaceae bacterium]